MIKLFTDCEKTMKVTLETLFESHPAFELLGRQFFSVSKIIPARSLFESVNGHYAVIAEKQKGLLEFYGKKKESGEYEIEDEKKPFYEKELQEFLSTEVEIDWEPVKVEELGDIRMPLLAYELLKFLFVEEDQKIIDSKTAKANEIEEQAVS